MWKTVWIGIGFVCVLSVAAGADTLGLWEFDTPGSVLQDRSGNGLDGIVGFDVSTETDPLPDPDTPSGAAGDRSLKIRIVDSAGGPVVADDSANKILDLAGQPFTAELWIKVYSELQGLSWRGTVYYGRHGTGWGIGTQDRNVKFTLFGVVDMFPGISLQADGQWHHLAFVYEPQVGVSFYLDGALFIYQAETRAMIRTNTNILWLGTEDGASRPIPAYLDRFRVTRGLLDETQLDSNAANPKPVTADTLVYFPFDETAGPEFRDVAGGLIAYAGTTWFALNQAPDYVNNTPTGSGYALDFIQGDHAIIRDPEEKLNFEDHSFSLEAWAKPGTFAQDTGVVLRYGGSETAPADSGGYGITLNQANGTVNMTFYRIDGGSDFTISSPANSFPWDGAWHHVAVVYSEEDLNVTIYVDGQMVHQEDYGLGILTAKDASLLHIGGQWDGREAYIGSIDRVRVTSDALTAGQLDYTAPVVSVEEWAIF